MTHKSEDLLLSFEKTIKSMWEKDPVSKWGRQWEYVPNTLFYFEKSTSLVGFDNLSLRIIDFSIHPAEGDDANVRFVIEDSLSGDALAAVLVRGDYESRWCSWDWDDPTLT